MTQNLFEKPTRSYGCNVPLDIGVVHFVGIGGIGMSGIAEILHNLGYPVSGSDAKESANVQRLRALGITVYVGQKAENVKEAAVVVKSTAVPMNNPEIMAARQASIPVVKRSEMLAELTRLKHTIAVAGAHGKTTTTSLMAHMMSAAHLDPTVINGGIINSYGTNVHLGQGDWLVVEADESDGTFIKIPASVGIVTNMDPEHLDHWGSYDNLKEGFRTFLTNLPFYGFALLCADDADVWALAQSVTDRKILTYAIENEQADIHIKNIRQDALGSQFDLVLGERLQGGARTIVDISLPVVGVHNVLNAVAVVGVAVQMGIADAVITSGFKDFSGVGRRFTHVAEIDGITIIDDYGHHPTEINATLQAARTIVDNQGKNGKVIAVVQPHRYSRLENLFLEFSECFSAADKVVITEVFSAGEAPIAGVDRDALVGALRSNDKDVYALESEEKLATLVRDIGQAGDMVICMGAGSITSWAHALPEAMMHG